MPSLYRPKIVSYRLPDGNYRTPDGRRVTKDTPGAVRTVEEAKKWYGRYTDANGKTQRVPLSESKETARRMLNKIAGDAELGSVGIGDPLAVASVEEAERRPAFGGYWQVAVVTMYNGEKFTVEDGARRAAKVIGEAKERAAERAERREDE
jgi:hypothetical protein